MFQGSSCISSCVTHTDPRYDCGVEVDNDVVSGLPDRVSGIGGSGGGDNIFYSVSFGKYGAKCRENKVFLETNTKKLSDGKAPNPIRVAIESKNQGGFQQKCNQITK